MIDPLSVMDEFGTDALRFTLLVGSTPGNDMNLGLKKVEANRNFANKMWNAGRFVISAIDSRRQARWRRANTRWPIRGSGRACRQLVRDVERLFQTFQYGEAGRQIYEFIWSDFADWYVEIAKQELAGGGPRGRRAADTLARVFDISLRLLHPFTPFVTEELWGHLRQSLLDSPLAELASDWPAVLIAASWPEPRDPEGWEPARLADFSLLQDVVRAVRNLRSEKNIPLSKKLPALIAGGRQVRLAEGAGFHPRLPGRAGPGRVVHRGAGRSEAGRRGLARGRERGSPPPAGRDRGHRRRAAAAGEGTGRSGFAGAASRKTARWRFRRQGPAAGGGQRARKTGCLPPDC